MKFIVFPKDEFSIFDTGNRIKIVREGTDWEVYGDTDTEAVKGMERLLSENYNARVKISSEIDKYRGLFYALY